MTHDQWKAKWRDFLTTKDQLDEIARIRAAHEANKAERYSDSWYETFAAWDNALTVLLTRPVPSMG